MELIAALLPEGLAPWVAGLLTLASFFTSALTAAFGVGGGIAMLTLMGLFVPVASLIPVHGAVQLGSNTGRAWHQRAFVRMDIAAPFVVGSVVGAIGGAFLVVQLPDALLKLILGAFVLLLTWAKIPGIERLSMLGLGLASIVLAVATMFVGATGPLVSAIFANFFQDDRKALVATHAVAMTAQHFLKIVVFGVAGFAFHTWLPLIAAMVLSGYLGTIYGTRLLERLPEAAFRRWFRIGLTVLALDLLRRGISGLL
ncbi:MAG: sulfite exporter TauE/SafE family protein [Alphaproteobacteria bacterium]|nr:sulfite exporter TauE/SafE family protein [Alphaproteobacteria bacterium]MBU0804361.1 sulfite exporter TauE/SafE family protein [Alphaproteobacteria bacterium]MBU0871192.1 sulfite exporter TauE/SafE family protein [Alphaproteobacteria bacterium]MBU1592636.1 sulfite exporter TauE/SafE family protein [Alphaproteobacteria bacterium]MBU1789799.1 sulfite exporter TauE/SafE family protein [Alphaproteobacteria bacterium]